MNLEHFGMDTITLAGPLEAKLHAIRAAGFTQVMLKYSKDPIQIGFSTNSGEVRSDQNDHYQLALIY